MEKAEDIKINLSSKYKFEDIKEFLLPLKSKKLEILKKISIGFPCYTKVEHSFEIVLKPKWHKGKMQLPSICMEKCLTIPRTKNQLTNYTKLLNYVQCYTKLS